MRADLCTENSRVNRLLSSMEEMRFVFSKSFTKIKIFLHQKYQNYFLNNPLLVLNSSILKNINSKYVNLVYKFSDE